MVEGNSRAILTNQQGFHEKLDALVTRYRTTQSRRPISEHTMEAFQTVEKWLGSWRGPIIIDSCCGVGESTARIATLYPHCKVIGIDKSAQRVEKHSYYQTGADNYAVFRADVNDFWRLARNADWVIERHFLLYPNPYPKSSQIQKRWYACAAMADLMALTPNIEVRSNWMLYVMEFARAAEQYGITGQVREITGNDCMTPFERKYRSSGQVCWQLNTFCDESE